MERDETNATDRVENDAPAGGSADAADAEGEHHTTAEAERERRARAERFQAEHPELLERGRRTNED